MTTARDEAVQLVRDGAVELPGLKDDLHRLQKTLAEKEEELVECIHIHAYIRSYVHTCIHAYWMTCIQKEELARAFYQSERSL